MSTRPRGAPPGGKVHVFLAVDRVSKLLHAEIPRRRDDGGPGRFPTGFTPSSRTTACASPTSRAPRNGITASFRVRVFDRVCHKHGIKHRLTKPSPPPWTNGQAERMVRTLKEASVKSFHYETRADLEPHLRTDVVAYNLGKHLKRLDWRTPFQTTCDAWKKDPTLFKADPHPLIPRP